MEKNPNWYKDAVIYELHVRAFCDSNGDGIGDFPGLTSKLDYLADLGVTAIWLLPFFPSPLRDDGYDISSYADVNEIYGSLDDFKYFLEQAHQRNLRVIIELVLNHTSDKHPWFQLARKSPAGSLERNFYVWSDTNQKYSHARIIFKDFETSNWTWDSTANAYYWHRFYSHQPDLNFDNPAVHKALTEAMDFWFTMGVDGMRLDAIPYLYEREDTNCENLNETHDFLKLLRKHVDTHYEDKMLLAEANQWPEDAAAYFGKGDECHMNFHFPIMPRMFMALRMEDRHPIIDILKQTPNIPASCQWATFLRNHDELTLEMVTDEERDYMYRMYARDQQARINLGIRRRLAPLVGNDRRQMELLNALLFSLPGTPVLYYGDEIGMGDNIYLGDRNGVRTPMQWNNDRNAGFSQANPQKLYLPIIIDPEYHYESLNVENQQNNPYSLYWWSKRLMGARKQYPALAHGSVDFLEPDNRKVLAFLRSTESQKLLMVFNLSKSAEYLELNLSEYRGKTPVEVFSSKEFPPIGDLPYFITLPPHTFMWFSLEDRAISEYSIGSERIEPPVLSYDKSWMDLLLPKPKSSLTKIFPSYLQACRWFAGKGEAIKSIELSNVNRIELDNDTYVQFFIEVHFKHADSHSYQMTLAHATSDKAKRLLQDSPRAVFAQVCSSTDSKTEVLYDALLDEKWQNFLLATVANQRRVPLDEGTLLGCASAGLTNLLQSLPQTPVGTLMRIEQSNNSLRFGQHLILKVLRKTDENMSLEVELGDFLTKAEFPYIATVYGWLEYKKDRSKNSTLGVLHRYVPNDGDAWGFALEHAQRYYESALAMKESERKTFLAETSDLWDGKPVTMTETVKELMGYSLVSMELLGKRTAELHLALGSDREKEAFRPEPFSDLYRRSLYQNMRNQTAEVLQLIKSYRHQLEDTQRPLADGILKKHEAIYDRFYDLMRHRILCERIRCHGDLHLGQVLHTGKDFVFIDFEGEPKAPLSERRIKRCPLRDVAGMIRSFSYAAHTPLRKHGLPSQDTHLLPSLAKTWYERHAKAYYLSYLSSMAGVSLIPTTHSECVILLRVYLLEKALYEVGYEIHHRPDWFPIPAQGVLELLT